MAFKRLSDEQLVELVEAAIFVSEKPLSKRRLQETVLQDFNISAKRLTQAIDSLVEHYSTRGVQLVEVASGYRFQAGPSLAEPLSKLWPEKAVKYSRATIETLALIAYRQPITRGEIEQVRGVAVSSNIMKSLLEREWITVVGQKDVPGKPALYATTKQFLDYFSLSGLEQLPNLPEQQDVKLEQILSDPSVREPS
ncbi:SMC-Scp complex subunit ScpB [Pseudoalteromonas phenolica]|jgi:segregation and condensation protein B|uniref:Segregation and condensation protein B n=1 Tax=Pseudoalteromonas phenolica TaxID=161398 RepID=A0A0S2K329_9GAMM|nr:SMC-Scp complex subunit ScpB [Pseudoalteromonas phenolica]ALO42354.1 Segregation and condensation protein B [Pseudoalteromonas phenolica]MBE0356550.1 segregation and condensation protein B [Pseudoalteromonas phenolica O-BC30]RXE96997.1 SMC-Scp complex subunit ScpB [Pseudoalteromonas phenolica O-BC30]